MVPGPTLPYFTSVLPRPAFWISLVLLSGALGVPAQGQERDGETVESTEGAAASFIPEPSDTPPPGGPAEGFGPPRPDGVSRSRSIGATNRGRLQRGVALDGVNGVHIRTPNHAYGTQEFTNLLSWASAQVEAQYPGSRLLIGDLSRERGGRIRPHRSHRVGRDADVGFYLIDSSGEPAMNNAFVGLRRTGVGKERRSERELKFDDVRNWALVAALMGQDVVPIQYIMVISPLKERLLAEAQRQNAPAWLIHRVMEAVGPRRTGRGRWARYGTHNSHFHIRIYCDGDDKPRCRDSPPYWDWVPERVPSPEARQAERERVRQAVRRRRSRSSMMSSMRSRMRSSMRSTMRSSMRSRMSSMR
ncbi:MAG: penicillin-insensitive murein endopeptidase [Polyangiales bacterium]